MDELEVLRAEICNLNFEGLIHIEQPTQKASDALYAMGEQFRSQLKEKYKSGYTGSPIVGFIIVSLVTLNEIKQRDFSIITEGIKTTRTNTNKTKKAIASLEASIKKINAIELAYNHLNKEDQDKSRSEIKDIVSRLEIERDKQKKVLDDLKEVGNKLVDQTPESLFVSSVANFLLLMGIPPVRATMTPNDDQTCESPIVRYMNVFIEDSGKYQDKVYSIFKGKQTGAKMPHFKGKAKKPY